MGYCSACKDYVRNNISSFGFPANMVRKLEWCQRLGLDMDSIYRTSTICENHFAYNMFSNRQRTRLKKDAVPVNIVTHTPFQKASHRFIAILPKPTPPSSDDLQTMNQSQLKSLTPICIKPMPISFPSQWNARRIEVPSHLPHTVTSAMDSNDAATMGVPNPFRVLQAFVDLVEENYKELFSTEALASPHVTQTEGKIALDLLRLLQHNIPKPQDTEHRAEQEEVMNHHYSAEFSNAPKGLDIDRTQEPVRSNDNTSSTLVVKEVARKHGIRESMTKWLEDQLFEKYTAARDKKESTTTEDLKKWAMDFATELRQKHGSFKFTASRPWLRDFKKRHGIIALKLTRNPSSSTDNSCSTGVVKKVARGHGSCSQAMMSRRLDDLLFGKYEAVRYMNRPITTADLKKWATNYANEFRRQYGAFKFTASNAWLEDFKKMHGIVFEPEMEVCEVGGKFSIKYDINPGPPIKLTRDPTHPDASNEMQCGRFEGSSSVEVAVKYEAPLQEVVKCEVDTYILP